MSIELESAKRIAALRDKADAVTGEASDTLAGAVDALIAGYGGSFESGEVTVTNAAYAMVIGGLSSKKTHLVVIPKVFQDPAHNTKRGSYHIAVEGWGALEITRARGIEYNTAESADTLKATFNDTSISLFYSLYPHNVGEYYWFAW